MFKYDYYRAETPDEVCEVLARYQGKARIVAGGTDIMLQIREKDKRWKELECLLDLSFLEDELRYIREEGDQIRSEVIERWIPFLGKAASTVGSPQIRNRGTIGGSICNASPAADPLTPLIALDAWTVIRGRDGERVVTLKDL